VFYEKPNFFRFLSWSGTKREEVLGVSLCFLHTPENASFMVIERVSPLCFEPCEG